MASLFNLQGCQKEWQIWIFLITKVGLFQTYFVLLRMHTSCLFRIPIWIHSEYANLQGAHKYHVNIEGLIL